MHKLLVSEYCKWMVGMKFRKGQDELLRSGPCVGPDPCSLLSCSPREHGLLPWEHHGIGFLHQGLAQICCQATQLQKRELNYAPGHAPWAVQDFPSGSGSSIGLTGTLLGVFLPGDLQRVWNHRAEPGSHCCGALCDGLQWLLRSNQFLLRSFTAFFQTLTLGQGKNSFNQLLHPSEIFHDTSSVQPEGSLNGKGAWPWGHSKNHSERANSPRLIASLSDCHSSEHLVLGILNVFFFFFFLFLHKLTLDFPLRSLGSSWYKEFSPPARYKS